MPRGLNEDQLDVVLGGKKPKFKTPKNKKKPTRGMNQEQLDVVLGGKKPKFKKAKTKKTKGLD